MNQTVAKRIRRSIYKDSSKRNVGPYSIIWRVKTIFRKALNIGDPPKEIKTQTGQIITTGLRAEYKKAKKGYYRGTINYAK